MVISSGILLLDRDGTLIEHRPYLCNPDHVNILPDCVPALEIALKKGFSLVIVSNQSAINRGICSLEQVERVNRELVRQFSKFGIYFEKILFCPHAPLENCHCRKPKTGLVEEWLRSDPRSNNLVMIGDSKSDIDFGRSLGATTILYGAQEEKLRTVDSLQFDNWRDIGVWISAR